MPASLGESIRCKACQNDSWRFLIEAESRDDNSILLGTKVVCAACGVPMRANLDSPTSNREASTVTNYTPDPDDESPEDEDSEG